MRGLPVQTLAFPMAAIPTSAKTAPVELPVVYAVARQESSFNVGAVSAAGARGLLQLMPATAKKAASVAGLPFSEPRLTQDAAYNATLGAEHLGELFDGFGGSYVMTFASYNAGREPHPRLGQAAWRPARPQGRRRRLDRAHPLHRDAQLRPAPDGKPAGLSRPARLPGPHHRSGPPARPGELKPPQVPAGVARPPASVRTGLAMALKSSYRPPSY